MIFDYPFDAELIRKKRVSLRKKLLADETVKFIDVKIAILGGSTTSEIKNMMELFLLNFGIKPSFYESEYNKYYEDGMFDNPALAAFGPDIVYIHTSNRNILKWPAAADKEDDVGLLLKNEEEKFHGLWDHLFEKYHCAIIQNNFELPFYRLYGNQDPVLMQGKSNYVNRLNEMVYAYARGHENFFVHDIHYESAAYGLDRWCDPYYWHMYKYAVAVPAIPYTAYGVSLIVKSLLGKNKKVLALDLDNTLWGGVIGDDGAEHIEIGQETPLGQTYSEFQSYVREQKQIGTLLTVISKNNDDVARTGFERPDSVLKTDDFVSFKANWEPKDRNLVAQAGELSLLPESFVFVDDNPAEREIIRQSVPGAAIPEIERVEDYIRTIDRAGYFEVTKLSADDLKRNEMYRANARRLTAQASFTDYGEYLKSLEMEGTIRPFEDMYLSRIAQLTNKSNQFNLTTRRYTQAEIEEIAKDGRYITLYGKLKDKFGDNGVVSIVIGEKQGAELHLRLWLMSCRVLKREMEFAMMDELAARARADGVETIWGYYYPTAKNGMVRELYGQLGFEKTAEDEEGNSVWRFEPGRPYENKNHSIRIVR